MRRIFLLHALTIGFGCAIASAIPPAQSAAAPGSPVDADAPYAQRLDVPRLAALGALLFRDPTISASGRVSCASCHDPGHAFGPADAAAIQPGAATGPGSRGLRATPSLRYLQSLPPFSQHAFDNDGDDSVDKGPTGGHMWDGRAGSAHEQARLPLLSASEMANRDAGALAVRLRRSPLAPQLRMAFGSAALADDERAVDAAALALEVYQQTPAQFYPYSSRYDEVLRGRARLTDLEALGLALFNDRAKGNCAACHPSAPTPDGAFPLFTDFGHIAIGVPRNRALAANRDPGFFDLGLCGPLRTDLRDQADACGRFRTPTLRNVAVRRAFFHNGVVRSLDDAVRFYAQRDTAPGRWYHGAAHPDDLPPRYRGNLERDPPFGRHPGDPPALDEAEIGAIVAFLRTLTDADLTPPAAASPHLRAHPE